MRLLASFENALQAIVEGAFGRAFPGRAHPAEIARRLLAEMRRTEILALGRTYVANAYRVFLNPRDYAGLQPIAPALREEYRRLLKHAVETEGYALYGPITVELEPDPRLPEGQFRVGGTTAEGRPAARLVGLSGPAEGRVFDIRRERTTIGRLASCDIALPQADVSRNHAALVAEGDGYVVEDLGSTNGTFVNGMRTARHKLAPSDLIEIGRSVFRFELE